MQALPGAEERTAEAIGSGTGIDDNAAIETIKAERQHANQVRWLPLPLSFYPPPCFANLDIHDVGGTVDLLSPSCVACMIGYLLSFY